MLHSHTGVVCFQVTKAHELQRGFGYLRPCLFVLKHVFIAKIKVKKSYVYSVRPETNEDETENSSRPTKVFILSSDCLLKSLGFYLLYKKLCIKEKQRRVSRRQTGELRFLLHVFQILPVDLLARNKAVDEFLAEASVETTP